jgi:hypothetical protein
MCSDRNAADQETGATERNPGTGGDRGERPGDAFGDESAVPMQPASGRLHIVIGEIAHYIISLASS